MSINKIIITSLSLLTMTFFSACGDEDSAFSGGDNYITSFQLKQGDITLNASISSDEIVITAPETLSLTGATANIILSENARIDPNPASITDWDTNKSFVVTAHNGTKSTYNYRVEHNIVSREGDVTLLTQEDVEEFAALNPSRINGSLTIGAVTGADSVYSLEPLSGIKSVVFNLVINPTYAGSSLKGLDNLQTIGSLQIGQVKRLKSADFPKLESVMTNLIINGAWVESVNFPELKTVDKGLQIQNTDYLINISFPKLQKVIENMTVQGSWSVNRLKTINFPSLEKIGGNLNLSLWTEVTKINLPLLKNVIAFSATSLPKMESLNAPKLESVMGDMVISACNLLTDMNFTSLKTISGSIRLENVIIENLDGLKSLTSIGNELFISNMSELKSSKGLKALKSVGGRIYISNWLKLEDDIEGLSSLSQVGGDIILYQIPFKKFTGFSLSQAKQISLFGDNLTTIQEIDLSNITLSGLQLTNILTPFTLKGKDVCDYNVSWGDCNFSKIEGFKEIKNLSYSMSTSTTMEAVLNVSKISNILSVSAYGLDKVSMPNLTEVGGIFDISSSPKAVELPLLKKVGKATIDASPMKKLSMPALQTVNGDYIISSGTYNADELAEIDMPALTTVNGILNISGFSSYYGNSKLKNLDGFPALKSVIGITVSYNSSLTDFKGLKNVLPSLVASNWKVSYNAYNPSYEDMLAGKYVKP